MSIIEMSKTVTLNEASAVAETSTIGAATMDSTATTVTFKEKKGGVVIADGKTSGIKIVSRDNMITDAGGTVALTLTEKTTGIHLEDNVISMTGNETEAVVITDETNLQHQEAGINKKAISTNLNLGISNELDSPQEIVFIDSSVGGYEELANGVLPGRKVVILDSSLDGFGQIVRVLEEHPQVLSIHIVSHGTPGSLFLGNSEFNLNSIDSSNTQTLELKALSVKNILLYGCYLAAGPCGREFIEKVHQLTGANIAASARLTGGKFLGGDWELEFVRGELEVVLPFTKEIQRTWGYVLSAFEDRPAVYQIREGVLKELNPLTREFIDIGDTGIASINAAGLNRADNYMYAMERVTGTSHRLVRIDSTGTVEYVTSSGGTSSNSADAFTLTTANSSKPAAGDVDDKGYLWVVFKSEDEDSINSSVYRIKLTDPSHVSTGEINTIWTNVDWHEIAEDVAYVNADGKDYLFGVNSVGRIFEIDISAAAVDQDVNTITQLVPDMSSSVNIRDANGNSTTNRLIGDFISFDPITGVERSNFEAAWTGSEGGLYVSKNGQAYNMANFSPDEQPDRAAEELVSNTDGQNIRETDGVSTSDLSSVFHIPLIDLNGTETGDKNLDDVDYDAGTFTEGDPAVDIVETTTGTVPNPENPSNPVFNNGLIIKDYINISDPDNITTATNNNNSGVVSAGDRLATATVTLTNAYDGDELLVSSATVADGASTTVGSITIARAGTGNTAGTNNIALTLTPTTGTTASVDDFNAAIKAIQFKNTSEAPNNTNRTIQFVLTDADGNTSD
ncbi:MAG: DUF4347 domain-containing protein, partial [Trichodesmium erythraeum GBRTRLIN201]|nr:DUF4347 domain-containing protein [Trichodesmium erythraeum GBRTRLIN201]